MSDKDKNDVFDWLNEIVKNQDDWILFYSSSEVKILAENALVLLKEKEKVPVVFSNSDGQVTTSCGNCGWDLDKTYSRCPRCQRELDWNALQE